MQSIDALVLEYGKSHRNSTNQIIHWICIPLITFTVVAFGWLIPSAWMSGWLPSAVAPWFNFATIGAALALIYYWRLAPWVFAAMLAFVVVSLVICNLMVQAGLPLLWIAVAIFVVTWIAQFYGHHVEGAKPSFFQDLQFLLVGPVFLLDKLRRGKFID